MYFHTSLHNRIKQMLLRHPPRVSGAAANPWAVTSLNGSWWACIRINPTDPVAQGFFLPTLSPLGSPRDSWLCVGGFLKSLWFVHCLYPAWFENIFLSQQHLWMAHTVIIQSWRTGWKQGLNIAAPTWSYCVWLVLWGRKESNSS